MAETFSRKFCFLLVVALDNSLNKVFKHLSSCNCYKDAQKAEKATKQLHSRVTILLQLFNKLAKYPVTLGEMHSYRVASWITMYKTLVWSRIRTFDLLSCSNLSAWIRRNIRIMKQAEKRAVGNCEKSREMNTIPSLLYTPTMLQ